MDHSTYQKLFQKLPKPFTIINEQIRSAYQSLYDRIFDLYKNGDFRKINIILTDSEYTAEILKFKIPNLEDNQEEDTLLIDTVELLYKIITIYPVKYFTTQLSAASFLNTFLEIHRKVPNLVLDWHPFYKVIKYYFLNPESQEVFGISLVSQTGQDFEDGPLSVMTNLLKLSFKISKYFQDEYEIEVNGVKTKTNTTEQLVKKCFPRISPNGSYTPVYLKIFAHLCPPHKNRYKLYIEYLLLELRDTSTSQCLDSILMLINRLILCNIEDDFSFLVPIITQFISLHIIKQEAIEYSNVDILDVDSFFLNHKTQASRRLSEIFISLFFSPPTRENILKRFESLFISFKSLCHPSISEMKADRIINFTKYIVLSLKKGLKTISNEKKDKIFYNMPKEAAPTQDDIHRLLSMICEMKILLIRMMNFGSLTLPIVIETALDPLVIDRYYDFAYQCINLIDVKDVAYNGWIVLSALVYQIDKNEKIRENFESIFESAASNFFRADIRMIISRFFCAVFSKIPFNKEKTVKGCEKFNFPKLAHLLVSNLMTLFRTLPSINEKTSKINSELLSNILLFFASMVQNCDSEVMQELLPIFTSLPTDDEMSPSVYDIEPIIIDYCLYANMEQKEAVISSFKKQLLLPHHSHSRFRYLSIIFSTISLTRDKTYENVKETTDLLFQFTTDEVQKIRKHAWKAISFSLSLFSRLHNLKVTLNPDKMINNPLENAKLGDFDIEWKSNPNISELAFQLFDPIFDKMMTIEDPHEMDDLLKEIGSSLVNVIESIPEVTKGSVENEVSYALVDSLHDLTQLHRDSVPFKEKFLKCALRIIKDFHEHEATMVRIIGISKTLFISIKYLNLTPSNFSMKLLFNFFPSINHQQPYYNSQYVYTALNTLLSNRKRQIIVPITDDIRQLFSLMVQYGLSTYRSIRISCSDLLSDVTDIYPPLFEPIIASVIDKARSIPIDEFLDFLSFYSVIYSLGDKDKLLCRTMLILADNLDMKDQQSLLKLKNFMIQICIFQLSFETPKANKQEYIDLLTEIEENYLKNKKINRTVNLSIILIVYMSLKHVYDVNNKMFEYIMKNVTHFDMDISTIAVDCLATVLRRRAKVTKEKIEVKKFPAIATFPNPIDLPKVKFPEEGVYFPQEYSFKETAKTTETVETANPTVNDEIEEEEEEMDSVDDEELDKELAALNVDEDEIDKELAALDTNGASLADAGPSLSLDVSINNVQLKGSVIKIFETFEKLEIDWLFDDDTSIYDTELYTDMSNGHFMFRDHFYHKKFDFFKDDFLIKSISGIFSSALNSSSNNSSDDSLVQYVKIWKMYSITVGPNCIEKLKEISIKYLSDSSRVEVVSKVLCEVLQGMITNILYWPVEDRIKFFKSVVFPVIFIVSANPNTSSYTDNFVLDSALHLNPISVSPILSVLYEMSQSGPNPPLYVRSLTSMISFIVYNKPLNFFNAIDQITLKYIKPFLTGMSEYSSNAISDIVSFIFYLFDVVSLSDKKSPLYSSDLESKKKDVVTIFEDLIESNKKDKNENLKKMLIKTITSCLTYCITSSYDVNLMCAPIIYNHLHTIFDLLNSSGSQDEESFIDATSDFIKNPIFNTNTKMELEFVTFLVKEMMNLALPMQLILLESLNEMLELNICNIPIDDYKKYVEILLNYGRYEKAKNLGNEARMKIAKILGIFEIRKCTLNYEVVNNKNADQDEVNDEVLKAAAYILNSFLFDKVDEKVTRAFNLMEETVGNRRSKNRDFFKSVSEVFIYRHSEHVLPEVEEAIIHYRSVVIPDYIC